MICEEDKGANAMYDLKSSSIYKYRDEKVKPLSLSVLLFSVLAIMFMTSSLQSIILMPVFVMMNFREVKQALYHENPLAEISVLFEEFGKSDLCLLLQLFITGAMIALTLVLCFSLLKRKPASIALSRCGFARKYLLGLLVGALLFAAVSGNGSAKTLLRRRRNRADRGYPDGYPLLTAVTYWVFHPSLPYLHPLKIIVPSKSVR